MLEKVVNVIVQCCVYPVICIRIRIVVFRYQLLCCLYIHLSAPSRPLQDCGLVCGRRLSAGQAVAVLVGDSPQPSGDYNLETKV